MININIIVQRLTGYNYVEIMWKKKIIFF